MRNQTFKQRKMKKYHSLKDTKKDNQVTGYKVNHNVNDTCNNNISYERSERQQQQPTSVQPAHQLNNVQKAKQTQTNKPKIISRQNSATSLEIKDRLSLRKKRSNTNIMSSNKFKLQAQINNLQEQLQFKLQAQINNLQEQLQFKLQAQINNLQEQLQFKLQAQINNLQEQLQI